MQAIVPLKTARPEVPYLDTEQVQTILAVPESGTLLGARDAVMLQLLYGTGARVSEATGVKLSDLQLDGKTPSVLLHGKGNKLRTLPLRASIVAVITHYLAMRAAEGISSDYLLASSRGHGQMTRSAVSRRLARLLSEPECVPITTNTQAPITAHTFRHSLATHLLESGSDLLQVRDILGHVSLQTTNIYLRASLARKREALGKLHGDEGGQPTEAQWRKPGILLILERSIAQALCCQT